MAFEKPVVVIDNGSYTIKAGFACDNHPVSIFRTVVGRPKYLNGKIGKEPYDVFIGDDAVSKMEDYDLNHPVINGRVVHWDNMERIWHNIFYKELKAAPEDRSVMIGVSPTTPIEEKYKYCEVMFEVLNAPAICIQPQSILALYGFGCTTGIAVDLGYDTVDINPVYEGRLLSYAHMRAPIAGAQISQYIKDCFLSRDIDFGNENDRIIQDVIKNHAYVSNNASISANKKIYYKNYTLTSGEEIDVSAEAFAGSELLFQPDLVEGNDNNDTLSLPDAVVMAASKCDSELSTDLYNTIVTSGGLSMLPGLNERLQIEIENIACRPAKILTSSESDVVTWLGGAVFAGMVEAQKIWVKKQQFEELGTKVVRRKFM